MVRCVGRMLSGQMGVGSSVRDELCVGRAEIEVDGVTKEFDVTPGLAAIVCHFQERESWPLGALAETCGVPEAVLQKRIAYWVSQGVVTEAVTGAGTVYTRAQTLEKRGGAWDDDDDAAEAAGGLAVRRGAVCPS